MTEDKIMELVDEYAAMTAYIPSTMKARAEVVKALMQLVDEYAAKVGMTLAKPSLANCERHEQASATVAKAIEKLARDAERYRWLTMTSDTNPIMVYDTNNDRLFFGQEADAAIDTAMQEKV